MGLPLLAKVGEERELTEEIDGNKRLRSRDDTQ